MHRIAAVNDLRLVSRFPSEAFRPTPMPPPETSSLSTTAPITIAGAGSVGCYAGGILAASGRNVTLLTRERLAAPIAQYGLRISDLDGRNFDVSPDALALATDPATAFARADVIAVTVKSHDTDAVAASIAAHANPDAIVVSLQNGVRNADTLRTRLGADRVVDAMVPFNVVQTKGTGAAPRFHRATSGTIRIENVRPDLRALLDVEGLPVVGHDDIDAVLWGKLVVNLNNALNALSDLPLVEQLGDRRWRLLVSRQLREGLAVLAAAKIRPAPVEGVPPRAMALALRLPDALFKIAAKGMLSVDRQARSSMWEDLEAGRPTEIDYLQGEIVGLADKLGLPAPLNRRVRDLVKRAETAKKGSPRLSPEAIETGV